MGARLCFVTTEYPPRTGGVATAASRVTRFARDAGLAVQVVTCASPAELGHDQSHSTCADDGITIHRVLYQPWDAGTFFSYRQFIRDLDRSEHFDLFHAFFLTSVHPCTEASGDRPVIASIRGGDIDNLTVDPYHRTQIFRALKRVAWITSVNQASLNSVGAHLEIEARSSVIRNSVAPGAWRWSAADTPQGVVGTTGEFRAVKDAPLLVRAYQSVTPAYRRKLIFAGHFPDLHEKTWSETLIEEFGLHDQVEVTGRFSPAELSVHLRRMYVYVQSSAREGMPNSLMEAAAHGIPLVTTAPPGIQEILTHGEDALLVPHGYPGELGKAIERVFTDRALAQHLSRGALRLAARHNPARERREWEMLYSRVLTIPGSN